MTYKDPMVILHMTNNMALLTDHPEVCKVVDWVQQEEPLPGVEEGEGGHTAQQQGSVVLAYRLNLHYR